MFSYLDACKSSCLQPHNALYLEEMFQRYQQDRHSVSSEWGTFFEDLNSMEFASGKSNAGDLELRIRVLQLIEAYRVFGVRVAKVNPLHSQSAELTVPELELGFYKLTEADLNKPLRSGFGGLPESATLRQIVTMLRDSYCQAIGTEYMHISDLAQRSWLQERLEKRADVLTTEKRIALLERLTAAETLERYLQTRYVGQKRFSLEGGEGLIPLLDQLVQTSCAAGVKEIVLGMAHRGRLNVLVNVLGKLPVDLFAEFEGKITDCQALKAGDVKYHKGFSCDIEFDQGKAIHLSLAFNPSHLEIVSPVVQGSVRARQDRYRDEARNQVVPVLIHGDAAFSGQGVVMETMNLAQTRGYRTGGTIHIVINNQIGFTTSDPRDARSTLYCTDIAKMVEAPVFHVNGDDPEAIVRATELAFEFRMKFHKDAVIDLVCFRLRGHNEADEPMVTQPEMYKRIADHPGSRSLYAARLVNENCIDPQAAGALVDQIKKKLESGLSTACNVVATSKDDKATAWAAFKDGKCDEEIETGVDNERLSLIGKSLSTVPPGFKIHSRVEKLLKDRASMVEGRMPLDWGMGELFAYGTLLSDGYPVRLSGQDSARGTFSHRHAVYYNQERSRQDAGAHVPLASLMAGQAHFTVIDSILSEEAVLGFEYGYATADANTLTLWEAQFGDFANGAQVVIDQFISSGEAKWGRLCGLVMLLPHGYEGQGAEHSSARLERYLQLCAEDNIQVCVPTTPAQMFHLLRRQMLRRCRKPLVVMTPKSLLRHKQAVSALSELTEGRFQSVLPDADHGGEDTAITRVLLCSGKVYYDLAQVRQERNLSHVAILRVEQLHPFPTAAVVAQLRRYLQATRLIWVQEEPKNQGAWTFVRDFLEEVKLPRQRLSYAGRQAAAAPAVGYHAMHAVQQKELIEAALSR